MIGTILNWFWPLAHVVVAIALATWQAWHWDDPHNGDTEPFPAALAGAIILTVLALGLASPIVGSLYATLVHGLPNNYGSALILMAGVLIAFISSVTVGIPCLIVNFTSRVRRLEG